MGQFLAEVGHVFARLLGLRPGAPSGPPGAAPPVPTPSDETFTVAPAQLTRIVLAPGDGGLMRYDPAALAVCLAPPFAFEPERSNRRRLLAAPPACPFCNRGDCGGLDARTRLLRACPTRGLHAPAALLSALDALVELSGCAAEHEGRARLRELVAARTLPGLAVAPFAFDPGLDRAHVVTDPERPLTRHARVFVLVGGTLLLEVPVVVSEPVVALQEWRLERPTPGAPPAWRLREYYPAPGARRVEGRGEVLAHESLRPRLEALLGPAGRGRVLAAREVPAPPLAAFPALTVAVRDAGAPAPLTLHAGGDDVLELPAQAPVVELELGLVPPGGWRASARAQYADGASAALEVHHRHAVAVVQIHRPGALRRLRLRVLRADAAFAFELAVRPRP